MADKRLDLSFLSTFSSVLPSRPLPAIGYSSFPAPSVLPAETVRYEAAATWEEYVRGTNQTTTVTRQVELLVQRHPHYYEVLFTTQAPSIAKKGYLEPLQEVALRLAVLYEQVAVKCSLTGQIQALLNHDALLHRWQTLRADLRAMGAGQAADPALEYLIGFCDQQLQDPANVVQSLQFDYLYQTLLASWVGVPTGQSLAPPTREFPQFFPASGLWFNEQTRWQAADATGLAACVVQGVLDEQRTDVAAIKEQLAASLAGEPVVTTKGFEQLTPHFGYQATHLVEEASHQPVRSELTVYTRLADFYNKQYTLLLTRL